MKKVKIFWTPFALKNLDLIKEYIIRASYSEKIANNYIRKLITRVEQLLRLRIQGRLRDF